MNNYQRLEVNLLPPEMAPSPAVRGTVVISWIIGLATLLIIGINAFWSMQTISSMNRKVSDQKAELAKDKPIEDTYLALKDIRDHTEGRGKLVGMASASYVEFPVLMDRVARLLPEGVYLVTASSSGKSGASALDLTFKTATNDHSLAPRTLEAFNTCSLFSGASLRSEDFDQTSIGDVKKALGIDYDYSSPTITDSDTLPGYSFEIVANISSPVDVEDLPVTMDNSDYMTQFTLASDPNAVPDKAPATGAGAAAGAAKPGQPAAGAPASGGAAEGGAPAGGGK
jgi:hypothetical protein